MARDAFDPGPLNNYPYWPRKADGTPDSARMPTGVTTQKDPTTGKSVRIDLTPRTPDGVPIVPPTIPPP